MSRPLDFLVVAGEISGDMHAARLVREIRRRRPDARFYGIGGDELAAAGMEVRHHVREMAVMGFVEVLSRLRFFRRVFYEMLAAAARRRPHAAILVDYPGFNLRFARRLHELGIRVIYYVCPQVWAWNRGRIPRMARDIDRLLAILPFEPALFEGTGLRTDFVGHPLIDESARALSEPLADLPWGGEPRVALLPGSRAHVIRRLLPLLLDSAREIERRRPGASFLVAAPNEAVAAVCRRVAAGRAAPSRWEVVAGRTRQALRQARAAIVASGTATLETALMRCPQVIVYRTGWATYWVVRSLIRVPHIGLVNVIAGKETAPELIQRHATPERVAGRILPLLDPGPERDGMLARYEEAIRSLGPGGDDARAAAIVLQETAE